MKISSIGVLPPDVPSAKNRPSFRENYDDYEMMEDADKFDLKETKRDLEDLRDSESSPSFLKKLANLGILITSGVITYGTTKYGLKLAAEKLGKIIKSPKVQSAAQSVTDTIKNKVAPQIKKGVDHLADSKAGKTIKQKAAEFAENKKVAPTIGFISNVYKQSLNGLKKGITYINGKLPEGKTVQDITIKTLSAGSAFAGAMGIENAVINNRNEAA